MYHSIPVLNDRFFTTCVITAQQTDTDLIVVQLPFDINALPEEFKQRSQRHPNLRSPKFEYKPTQSEGSYQDDEAAKKKDGVSLVEGRYVSVEYVSVGNTGKDGQSEVTWKMATASDAAGKIPQFVTNTSLPGQVINDVPWFLNWVNGRRN
ncbi:uncharacterized protein BDZ99DRAFT_467607 [Mytilinidion resinicola]|uniref:DUF3074 domain-containing protein n=1 Tax=Mytilinidion resinicola TaxID=574789 RepID=A0A6A6Y919_9PEZI|nr:uncharacterized protein BDZ99DRAFT_467607 [Mytilinidion resinicola]KAF2804317.1 hypothetical protein BDZ99DRAFT_467607 [Mytilinidion resinicola]